MSLRPLNLSGRHKLWKTSMDDADSINGLVLKFLHPERLGVNFPNGRQYPLARGSNNNFRDYAIKKKSTITQTDLLTDFVRKINQK